MNLETILGVIVIGLLGSGHCMSMCAPFAIAASAGSPRFGNLFARQLVYQLGKGSAYLSIGVVLLLLSRVGGRLLGSAIAIQNVLTVVTGAIMIAMGAAHLFEWHRLTRWFAGGVLSARMCGMAGALWRSPSLARALLIGWVNGFLPCGLSLTALTYLVSHGSAIGVAAGAYAFSFSTLPGLLSVAWLGHRVSVKIRRHGVRVAGVFLILFGILTMVRGVPVVHHWFHEHTIIEGGPAAGDAMHGEHGGHEGHSMPMPSGDPAPGAMPHHHMH